MGSQVEIPWLQDRLPVYADAFRCNVKEFLAQYGRKVPLGCLRRATAYIVELKSVQGTTLLHVYEEKLDEKDGTVCDQCRCMGWQNHPVSNFKYHFIIPAESTLEDNRQITAVVEGKYTNKLPLSFKWTPPAPEEEHDEEPGPYNAAHSVFESQDHLMHGVLHANGFGHLLRMNGSQGGSRKLIGKQLLSVWDRLCVLLRARQVSTEDVSNKQGMLLRVLHTAAYGTTWYGKIGYRFGRGSYNITAEQYQAAVTALMNVPLTAIAADFAAVLSREPMVKLLRHYSIPGVPIATLSQLLQRLLACGNRAEVYAGLYPPPPGWREPLPYQQLLLQGFRPKSGRGGKRHRSHSASPLPPVLTLPGAPGASKSATATPTGTARTPHAMAAAAAAAGNGRGGVSGMLPGWGPSPGGLNPMGPVVFAAGSTHAPGLGPDSRASLGQAVGEQRRPARPKSSSRPLSGHAALVRPSPSAAAASVKHLARQAGKQQQPPQQQQLLFQQQQYDQHQQLLFQQQQQQRIIQQQQQHQHFADWMDGAPPNLGTASGHSGNIAAMQFMPGMLGVPDARPNLTVQLPGAGPFGPVLFSPSPQDLYGMGVAPGISPGLTPAFQKQVQMAPAGEEQVQMAHATEAAPAGIAGATPAIVNVVEAASSVPAAAQRVAEAAPKTNGAKNGVDWVACAARWRRAARMLGISSEPLDENDTATAGSKRGRSNSEERTVKKQKLATDGVATPAPHPAAASGAAGDGGIAGASDAAAANDGQQLDPVAAALAAAAALSGSGFMAAQPDAAGASTANTDNQAVVRQQQGTPSSCRQRPQQLDVVAVQQEHGDAEYVCPGSTPAKGKRSQRVPSWQKLQQTQEQAGQQQRQRQLTPPQQQDEEAALSAPDVQLRQSFEQFQQPADQQLAESPSQQLVETAPLQQQQQEAFQIPATMNAGTIESSAMHAPAAGTEGVIPNLSVEVAAGTDAAAATTGHQSQAAAGQLMQQTTAAAAAAAAEQEAAAVEAATSVMHLTTVNTAAARGHSAADGAAVPCSEQAAATSVPGGVAAMVSKNALAAASVEPVAGLPADAPMHFESELQGEAASAPQQEPEADNWKVLSAAEDESLPSSAGCVPAAAAEEQLLSAPASPPAFAAALDHVTQEAEPLSATASPADADMTAPASAGAAVACGTTHVAEALARVGADSQPAAAADYTSNAANAAPVQQQQQQEDQELVPAPQQGLELPLLSQQPEQRSQLPDAEMPGEEPVAGQGCAEEAVQQQLPEQLQEQDPSADGGSQEQDRPADLEASVAVEEQVGPPTAAAAGSPAAEAPAGLRAAVIPADPAAVPAALETHGGKQHSIAPAAEISANEATALDDHVAAVDLQAPGLSAAGEAVPAVAVLNCGTPSLAGDSAAPTGAADVAAADPADGIAAGAADHILQQGELGTNAMDGNSAPTEAADEAVPLQTPAAVTAAGAEQAGGADGSTAAADDVVPMEASPPPSAAPASAEHGHGTGTDTHGAAASPDATQGWPAAATEEQVTDAVAAAAPLQQPTAETAADGGAAVAAQLTTDRDTPAAATSGAELASADDCTHPTPAPGLADALGPPADAAAEQAVDDGTAADAVAVDGKDPCAAPVDNKRAADSAPTDAEAAEQETAVAVVAHAAKPTAVHARSSKSARNRRSSASGSSKVAKRKTPQQQPEQQQQQQAGQVADEQPTQLQEAAAEPQLQPEMQQDTEKQEQPQQQPAHQPAAAAEGGMSTSKKKPAASKRRNSRRSGAGVAAAATATTSETDAGASGAAAAGPALRTRHRTDHIEVKQEKHAEQQNQQEGEPTQPTPAVAGASSKKPTKSRVRSSAAATAATAAAGADVKLEKAGTQEQQQPEQQAPASGKSAAAKSRSKPGKAGASAAAAPPPPEPVAAVAEDKPLLTPTGGNSSGARGNAAVAHSSAAADAAAAASGTLTGSPSKPKQKIDWSYMQYVPRRATRGHQSTGGDSDAELSALFASPSSSHPVSRAAAAASSPERQHAADKPKQQSGKSQIKQEHPEAEPEPAEPDQQKGKQQSTKQQHEHAAEQPAESKQTKAAAKKGKQRQQQQQPEKASMAPAAVQSEVKQEKGTTRKRLTRQQEQQLVQEQEQQPQLQQPAETAAVTTAGQTKLAGKQQQAKQAQQREPQALASQQQEQEAAAAVWAGCGKSKQAERQRQQPRRRSHQGQQTAADEGSSAVSDAKGATAHAGVAGKGPVPGRAAAGGTSAAAAVPSAVAAAEADHATSKSTDKPAATAAVQPNAAEAGTAGSKKQPKLQHRRQSGKGAAAEPANTDVAAGISACTQLPTAAAAVPEATKQQPRSRQRPSRGAVDAMTDSAAAGAANAPAAPEAAAADAPAAEVPKQKQQPRGKCAKQSKASGEAGTSAVATAAGTCAGHDGSDDAIAAAAAAAEASSLKADAPVMSRQALIAQQEPTPVLKARAQELSDAANAAAAEAAKAAAAEESAKCSQKAPPAVVAAAAGKTRIAAAKADIAKAEYEEAAAKLAEAVALRSHKARAIVLAAEAKVRAATAKVVSLKEALPQLETEVAAQVEAAMMVAVEPEVQQQQQEHKQLGPEAKPHETAGKVSHAKQTKGRRASETGIDSHQQPNAAAGAHQAETAAAAVAASDEPHPVHNLRHSSRHAAKHEEAAAVALAAAGAGATDILAAIPGLAVTDLPGAAAAHPVSRASSGKADKHAESGIHTHQQHQQQNRQDMHAGEAQPQPPQQQQQQQRKHVVRFKAPAAAKQGEASAAATSAAAAAASHAAEVPSGVAAATIDAAAAGPSSKADDDAQTAAVAARAAQQGAQQPLPPSVTGGSGSSTAAGSGSGGSKGQKKRKKSSIFSMPKKKQGWRWVVKPQYILDEEAAKKEYKDAEKAAKVEGVGPAEQAALQAARAHYLACKAVTERHMAEYEAEAARQRAERKGLAPPPLPPILQQPLAVLAAGMPLPETASAPPAAVPQAEPAAASKPAPSKKFKLKTKQPLKLQLSHAAAAGKPGGAPGVKTPRAAAAGVAAAAAAAAGKFYTNSVTTATGKVCGNSAAVATTAVPGAEYASVDSAAAQQPALGEAGAAAAAGEADAPALLGVSCHGRKRKASVAVREAVEEASMAFGASARKSKRPRASLRAVGADGEAVTLSSKASRMLGGLSGMLHTTAGDTTAAGSDGSDWGHGKPAKRPYKKREKKAGATAGNQDDDFVQAAVGVAVGRGRARRQWHAQDDAGSRAPGPESAAALPEPHHPSLKAGLLPYSVPEIRTVDQVLADLQYVYNNVLRVYRPQQVLKASAAAHHKGLLQASGSAGNSDAPQQHQHQHQQQVVAKPVIEEQQQQQLHESVQPQLKHDTAGGVAATAAEVAGVPAAGDAPSAGAVGLGAPPVSTLRSSDQQAAAAEEASVPSSSDAVTSEGAAPAAGAAAADGTVGEPAGLDAPAGAPMAQAAAPMDARLTTRGGIHPAHAHQAAGASERAAAAAQPATAPAPLQPGAVVAACEGATQQQAGAAYDVDMMPVGDAATTAAGSATGASTPAAAVAPSMNQVSIEVTTAQLQHPPAALAAARVPATQQQLPELQLKDLADTVQRVRDIKHFVKDYHGELEPEGWQQTHPQQQHQQGQQVSLLVAPKLQGAVHQQAAEASTSTSVASPAAAAVFAVAGQHAAAHAPPPQLLHKEQHQPQQDAQQQQQHGDVDMCDDEQVVPEQQPEKDAYEQPIVSVGQDADEQRQQQRQEQADAADQATTAALPSVQPDSQQQQQAQQACGSNAAAGGSTTKQVDALHQQHQQLQSVVPAAELAPVSCHSSQSLVPTVRLMVKLDLTASRLLDVCTVRLPDGSLRIRQRHTHATPAELILAPNRCSLADLKHLVTDTFAEMYRLAVGWKCEHLLGLPDDAWVRADHAAAGPSAQGQTAAAAAAAAAVMPAVAAGVPDAVLLLAGEKLPKNCEVTAVGSGLDPEPRFRHAGGVEDWAVQCRCGTCDDDGERMIVCDVCGYWMHTRCNGIHDDAEDPPGFTCEACSAQQAPAVAAAHTRTAAGGKRGRQ